MSSNVSRVHRGERWATLIAAGALCLAVGVLVYRGKHDAQSWVLADFKEQVYYPERAFLEGRNPYGGYPAPNSLAGYAPHTLLIHLPLGLVDYPTAAIAYQMLVSLLTVTFAYTVLRFSGSRDGLAATLGLAAAILVSRPGQMNFINGNVTVQVLLGAYVAFHYARRRPAVAAAGLALSLIKPTIGIPLAIMMLLGRGDVKAVVLGGVIAAVLSAMAMVVILPEAGGIGPFVASVRAGVEGFRAVTETDPLGGWSRVDVIPVVAKLMGRNPPLLTEIALGLAILASGVIGVRRLLARGGSADSCLVTTIVYLTILIFSYQQAYNVLILTLPLAALVVDPDTRPVATRPIARWTLVGLLVFPFLNYLSTYGALTRLGIEGWRWTLVTSLSGLALLTAWSVTLGSTVWPSRLPAREVSPLQGA